MRMFVRSAALFALLWLAAPLVPSAQASTALYLSEVEHAEQSDAVVIGAVTAQRMDRDPSSGRIYTHSTIDVYKPLMGHTPAQIEIRQMGGQLGEEVLRISGDATLHTGEEVCLFVRHVEGQWYLTAMEQSKYTVIPSLDGTLLERSLSGGLFLRSKGGDMTPYVDDSPGTPLTVARLAWILSDAGMAPEPTAPGAVQ